MLKHAALSVLLGYLTAKEKPLFFLDSHAGRGLYDLQTASALRAGEFRFGAARVLVAADAPPALAPYRRILQGLNPGDVLTNYPGSPFIIAQALRTQDRFIACDLHPEEAGALAATLRPFRRARAEAREGYGALKALLPPAERRGLVLIDPPFEITTEFADLGSALRQAWKRFPAGVYLVWYPLKDRAAADAFLAGIAEAGITDASTYELFVRAPELSPGMTGSGLLAINASFALDAPMRQILPYLAQLLAQGAGSSWRAECLTAE